MSDHVDETHYVAEEDDGLGCRPCGCPVEYHMADCPHLTGEHRDGGAFAGEPDDDDRDAWRDST